MLKSIVLAAYKHIFIISAILKEVFCKDTNLFLYKRIMISLA